MRVPVGVVLADPDEGDRGPGGGEEAGRVRVAAVVRHLQHLGAQRGGVAKHERLGEHLGVAGEEHPAVCVIEPQNERDLVEVVADGAGSRRRERDELGRAEPHPITGFEGRERHATALGRCTGHVRGPGGTLVRRVRADEQRAHAQSPKDRRQAAAVIVVRVGQHHRVEPADAPAAQVGER